MSFVFHGIFSFMWIVNCFSIKMFIVLYYFFNVYRTCNNANTFISDISNCLSLFSFWLIWLEIYKFMIFFKETDFAYIFFYSCPLFFSPPLYYYSSFICFWFNIKKIFNIINLRFLFYNISILKLLIFL